ncbi:MULTISPECIES: GlsB/YeaQ/YmgE family stress response membrane protein [Enterococcus]|uniref:Membrane protein n=2 Tax=root TaxID=1 RepID=A0A179ESA8_ENTTH|nr:MULTISPECIES: GlsB/YeaQ/YmgE family stress response membrane protein [Enterococcus]ASZ06540.1 GlsB/YeaQ/YmgE family stress response membrane protein [Enterococcus thailandicus]MDA3964646.1 GlsB/YeaQ/YmgE family stress response membrane protein [Enterococcus thailandicus]MDK4353178.1 GlsB/YeaQ/YmgE family stress response membrane protein [Enterococcus thailandicus]MDT2733879.1 GlsB/YeaQ/YmgE family stress response membrane protein [Enterococcus thailandicus]MDT2751432.1 GlsB/YeaQ/YmgE family
MLSFLGALVVGSVLGMIAGAILGKDVPGGCTGNIVVGALGSWLGELILGEFGPVIIDVYLIPALLGAILCLVIYYFIIERLFRS